MENYRDTLTNLPAIYLAPLLGLVLYVALSLKSQTSQLAFIPTVGYDGVLGSYYYAFRHFFHKDRTVKEGYKKYRGSLFKIAFPNAWLAVVSGAQLLDDMRRAKADELSFFFGIAESFESEMIKGINDHKRAHFHLKALTTGTKNLGPRYEDILDELRVSSEEILSANTDGWTAVPAYLTMQRIFHRITNRYFIGLPVCRDEDYQKLVQEYTLKAIATGLLCQYSPRFLFPVINFILSPMNRMANRVMKYTGPIIEERLRMEQEHGADWPGKPNDAISWLLDESPPEQRNPFNLTQRILFLNMAAVSSAASNFTNALYQLAADPHLAQLLREEVEIVISKSGWSKASLETLKLLESFEKENLRFNGTGVFTMNRMVVKPGGFTFSNGVTLPKGTLVSAAEQATHFDEDIYPNPTIFDPYRFIDKEDPNVMPPRITNLDTSYIIFGLGRYACPGRFFAATTLRALLCHFLLNYDMKLENDSRTPPPRELFLGAYFVPNTKAKLLFRKRKL